MLRKDFPWLSEPCRLTGEDLRRASHTFKRRTGVVHDHTHSRDISPLPDVALDVFIGVMLCCECIG